MEITSEEIELRFQQIEYHLVEILAYSMAETEEHPRYHVLKPEPLYYRTDQGVVRSAERVTARLRTYLTNLCASYSPRSVQMMERQSTELAHVLAGVQQQLFYSPPGAPPAPTTGLWSDDYAGKD